jgi:hypothetical protein
VPERVDGGEQGGEVVVDEDASRVAGLAEERLHEVAGRLDLREAGGARGSLEPVRGAEHLAQRLGAVGLRRALERDEAALEDLQALGEVRGEGGAQRGVELFLAQGSSLTVRRSRGAGGGAPRAS